MRKTRLIQVAAAVSTILALGTYSAAFAADVVIASSGGGWQEAQDKALWAPAAKALNITYTQDTFQNWAEARAQVESGSVTWDIIQIGIADEPQAKAAGVLEKLDPDVVNKADFPRALSQTTSWPTAITRHSSPGTRKLTATTARNRWLTSSTSRNSRASGLSGTSRWA